MWGMEQHLDWSAAEAGTGVLWVSLWVRWAEHLGMHPSDPSGDIWQQGRYSGCLVSDPGMIQGRGMWHER